MTMGRGGQVTRGGEGEGPWVMLSKRRHWPADIGHKRQETGHNTSLRGNEEGMRGREERERKK